MSKITQVNFRAENADDIRRVTCYGLLINTLLSAVKLFIGFVASSQVVIADAIHSFSDSATDIVIILGVKYWSRPPDRNHPYGHQKIETIITVIISLMLAAVALGIAYEGIITIKSFKETPPGAIAVFAPILSIAVKEILYRWNISVGKRIKSKALIANGWHHRSDVATSVLALVSVALAALTPGMAFIDNIGAVIVALLILKIAWQLLVPAISELIEAGASENTNIKIYQTAIDTEGVYSAHAIRTRKFGTGILVDLHILVDGNISVTEGHYISEKVQHRLINANADIIDVVVHIEPAES
ncbi:MAG: cation diffusion facilitator family transporter [Victivallales bacterium]|nr:cation diffusion facilitator family transporter [Victivallales bacterium]MCF7888968.1 cation diffusion facilitator family transporter [Victivallales bacterium]